MPEPKIRFFLRSVATVNDQRAIYLLVSIGEARPVRLVPGLRPHPAYFSTLGGRPPAPGGGGCNGGRRGWAQAQSKSLGRITETFAYAAARIFE